MSFGLYDPWIPAAHIFVASLTSGSPEHDAPESAATTASAFKLRMAQSRPESEPLQRVPELTRSAAIKLNWQA
jgi:hypothetical protein